MTKGGIQKMKDLDEIDYIKCVKCGTKLDWWDEIKNEKTGLRQE